MKKRFVNILVTLISVTTLVACNKHNGGSSSSELKPDIIEDKYIVQGSRSDYSVVIPKRYKDKEKMAADAFVEYMNKATGAKLSIIYDNEVVSGSHYISFGNTTVFNSTFKDISMDELDGKISSYFISTRAENIYVYSNPNERAEGTLYGAYDLLRELVNYEYYASDEIYYTHEADVNLRDYKNFFIHPTFDGRAIGNFHLIYNQDVCESQRIINQYKGTEWVSDIYGHSQVTQFVRPQDPYGNEGKTIHDVHPDWFSNRSATVADTTNNQLCWSAGEELEQYVADRFIQYFQRFPNATYFMFGQEDNSSMFCRCSRCQEAIQHGHAVNYAGLQIMFMNHVIEKTDAWLKENEPGRQVRYVVFAYYATKVPPVENRDGKWVPANEDVVPNKNLYFLYAPISCNFAFPLENNYFNSDTYLQLNQWKEIASGNLMIYLYDVNFRYYFANFCNFGTVKAMFQTCKDMGVSYMYTQGATDTMTSCFADMREYVESKLMWNINQDYEVLAKDFIDHYYLDASEDIYEYYQTVRDRLTEYHVIKGDGGGIYNGIANKEIYPYAVLRYFITLFKQAMEKIDHYRDENIDMYNSLKARIMREYLSVIYLCMTLVKAEIGEAEKAEMKDIFRTYTGYFGITRNSEGSPMIDIDALFA